MIRKIWKAFGFLILLAAPLLLLAIKLPLRPEVYTPRFDHLVLIFLYACVLLLIAGKLLAPIVDRSRAVVYGASLLIAALFAGLMSAPQELWNYRGLPACGLLLFTAFTWGVLSRAITFPAPAILSLMLMLNFFLLSEAVLDSLPEKALLKTVTNVPPIAPEDRGNVLFRRNGFRGLRPCVDCPRDSLRIFTMGGSSTFGTPMFYRNDSYTARLRRIVEERRPGEKIEIYNAGIPGYGIMQILDSIEKVIVKYRPDIITICAWFNDHSAIPGWYGFYGKSDKEAHELVALLRKIEGNRYYKKVSGTRLYGVFRYALLKARDLIPKIGTERSKRRPRMSPDEFAWAMEQIVSLSKKHDFLPVIILEATNRTANLKAASRKNKYYRRMLEISKVHNIPLVNPLDEFGKRKEEWLFYDFIHPNQAGHQIIAEKLYSKLFLDPGNKALREIYKSKGIDAQRPDARKEYVLQIPSPSLQHSALKLRVSMPEANDSDNLLELVINGDHTLIQTGVGNQPKDFIFRFDSASLNRPITDIRIRAGSVSQLSSSGTLKAEGAQLFQLEHFELRE
ncbi:MAG: SGNH/GDSL hydrolase family protein [Deltaproteobacteria bacterium]|nr:SGNH/GDSL hydrolase family protein [Deltaproteobacteria bacterium]